MRRKPNLLQRIEELETRLTDSSGFMPHSAPWLQYWAGQIHNMVTDQPHVPLTIEAFRAVVRASRDEGDEREFEKTGLRIDAM
jgi:hypothetical protein